MEHVVPTALHSLEGASMLCRVWSPPCSWGRKLNTYERKEGKAFLEVSIPGRKASERKKVDEDITEHGLGKILISSKGVELKALDSVLSAEPRE